MNKIQKIIASIFCVLMFVSVGISNTVCASFVPLRRINRSTDSSALSVTKVQLLNTSIGPDGYVYVAVNVTGIGNINYVEYDNECIVSTNCRKNIVLQQNVGSPRVTGEIYVFKCLAASAGRHKLRVNVDSVINRMIVTENFIVNIK